IHRLHVAVADVKGRAGACGRDASATTRETIPNPLGSDAGRLRLNLIDEVAAELSARRLREQLRAAQSDLARRDQVAFLLDDSRLTLHGPGGNVEVGIGADECLQSRLVARILVFAEGGVPAPGEPLQVGGGKRQWRGGGGLVE